MRNRHNPRYDCLSRNFPVRSSESHISRNVSCAPTVHQDGRTCQVETGHSHAGCASDSLLPMFANGGRLQHWARCGAGLAGHRLEPGRNSHR